MAVTAADVVLMTENLLSLPPTIRLCRYARAVMVQNCFLAVPCIKIIDTIIHHIVHIYTNDAYI
jgi:cation transport ATPase